MKDYENLWKAEAQRIKEDVFAHGINNARSIIGLRSGHIGIGGIRYDLNAGISTIKMIGKLIAESNRHIDIPFPEGFLHLTGRVEHAKQNT